MALLEKLRNRLTEWTRPKPLGRRGEKAAARFLRKLGYIIVARSDRHRLGELDMVAVDDRTVVFVEVKTRRSHDAGHPTEAVDENKQRRLTRLALAYLRRHDLLEKSARFNVVFKSIPLALFGFPRRNCEWRSAGRDQTVGIRGATSGLNVNNLVKSGWPELTSKNFLKPLVFSEKDLPAVNFDHRVAPAVDSAVDWLRQRLSGRRMHSRDIIAAAEVEGWSRTTLYRSRKRLGVLGEDGYWSLT